MDISKPPQKYGRPHKGGTYNELSFYQKSTAQLYKAFKIQATAGALNEPMTSIWRHEMASLGHKASDWLEHLKDIKFELRPESPLGILWATSEEIRAFWPHDHLGFQLTDAVARSYARDVRRANLLGYDID